MWYNSRVMKNYDFIELSNLCIRYLAILGPDADTDKYFREAYNSDPTHKGIPTIDAVREFMFDFEDEHSDGTDWLVGHWLMDMIDLNGIFDLPLSAAELLFLRLRLECPAVLLPLLCGCDPEDQPKPKYRLSISASNERDAMLWTMTSFWHHSRLEFYNTRIAMLHYALEAP